MSLIGALRIALQKNEQETVKALVHKGADVNAFFDNRETPLHVAVYNGNKEMVKFLLAEGAVVVGSSNNFESVVSQSARLGRVDMQRLLLPDRISHKKWTLGRDFRNSGFDMGPMYIGILHKNKSILEFFLERGADINMKNEDGLTLLQLAALQGHQSILEYQVDNFRDTLDLHVVDSNGFSILYTAASQNHVHIVQYLLETLQFDVNERSLGGETILHLVASAGYKELTTYVLEHGANVALTTEHGFSPLHAAIASSHFDIARMLVTEYGASVDPFDRDDNTPLHIAAKTGDLDMCTFLLTHGASIDLANAFGQQPADVAREHLHFHVSKFFDHYDRDGIYPSLIVKQAFELVRGGNVSNFEEHITKHRIDVDTVQTDGTTLLYTAAQFGALPIVELLLEKNAMVLKPKGMNPFIAAAESGHIDIVKLQYEKFSIPIDDTGKHKVTALLAACRSHHYDLVDFLVKWYADVNIADVYGNSPACVAALQGYSSIVRLLLKYKADVNSRTSYHDTLLHLCVLNEDDALQEDLIELGADVNAKNIDGYTPLHSAVMQDDVGMVFMLLHHHSSAAAVTKRHENAMSLACVHGNVEVVDMQIEHGQIDPNAPLPCGTQPITIAAEHLNFELVLKLHKTYNSDVDVRLKDGRTMLHAACSSGDQDMVKFFILENVPIDALDKNHNSPLHEACEANHLHVVEYLVQNGANKHRKSKQGKSPLEVSVLHNSLKVFTYQQNHVEDVLPKNTFTRYTPQHIAAEKGNLEVIQQYLALRVDLNVGKEDGVTPLHLACSKNQQPIVKIQLYNGADVHIIDNQGRSPLRIATLTSSTDVALFLRDYKPTLFLGSSSGDNGKSSGQGFFAKLFGWNK